MKKNLTKVPYLKNYSKKLRKESTYSEIQLWQYLKNKQLGFRFKRQIVISKFIVDFFSPELKLAIEIDGETHIGNSESDNIRQKELETLGVRFLRFSDLQIIHELPFVIRKIENWIMENTKN